VRSRRGVAILLSIAAGCADGAVDGELVTVRDSAGIVLVESSRPVWSEHNAWHVAAEPTVTIGRIAGEQGYLLDRITDAVRMTDGRFVLLNGGTQELRFYDAQGTYLHAAGGRGGGPGEFQLASRMFRMPGDSLFVVDPQGGRFTVMDESGAFARSYSPAGRIYGRLADGRVVRMS
jgi:hypothetical protein